MNPETDPQTAPHGTGYEQFPAFRLYPENWDLSALTGRRPVPFPRMAAAQDPAQPADKVKSGDEPGQNAV
jgi:hypothetical protein